MEEIKSNFTKVTIPKKMKSGKWEFSLFDKDDNLHGVMSFDNEKDAYIEHKKYVINGAIGEIKEGVELDNNQKLIILKEWDKDIENPPSISKLIELVFPDIAENLKDSRSLHGKAIKKFLAEKGFDANNIEKKREFELSTEQKEYIVNNCSSMRPFEMAKELFRNPRLSPSSIECKAVLNYVKTIDPSIIYGGEIPDSDYKAPKSIGSVLKRIKKYVSLAETWDNDKLTPIQKKNCDSLLHYLHDPRFKRQIDSYEKIEDKITFESEFIKYCYNKPNLEQEEISQYVSLCSFVVTEFNIKSNIEMLQTMMDNEYAENNKAQTNTVEALASARIELNNCTLRQGKLYDALTEKRSEKLGKELKDKASLLNLINAWRNYESRQNMLKLAKEKKDILRKEIHELENLEEVKMRILGMDVDEILNG